MDVTVITPVRNEKAVIHQTAATILGQRFDGSLEVLFVDGRSDDGTRDALAEIAAGDRRVRLLDNPRRDIPSALNIGLAGARGEFVAMMEAHALFDPDYLAVGVQRLRRGDVEWVTGPAVPHPRGGWSAAVALALSSPLGVGGSSKWVAANAPGGAQEWDLDTGVFSGVWRRATLERLGGWDEGWPVNSDSELAARYLEGGGRIVCVRGMGSRYIPRYSLSGLARQYSRYGYYRVKTSRRHPASMRRSHLLPPAITTIVAAAMAPGPIGRAARTAGAAYGAVLAAEGVRTARRADARAFRLPVVFATMHLAWGAGFVAGCLRFGLPAEAIRRLAVQDTHVSRPPNPGSGGA